MNRDGLAQALTVEAAPYGKNPAFRRWMRGATGRGPCHPMSHASMCGILYRMWLDALISGQARVQNEFD